MREPADVLPGALPRPGRVLKVVLALVAAMAILGAIAAHWVAGGDALLGLLIYSPAATLYRPWTLLTSFFVTSPVEMMHALFALLGLYFLTPTLEKKWGGARLVRFLVLSTLAGNLAVLLFDVFGSQSLALFHPGAVMGPSAAIAAIAVAFGKEHADQQIRLFFFLPVRAKALVWVTLGFAVLAVIFNRPAPEGIAAPFGGILAGLALGGSPSPARTLWLRIKLAVLRRRGHALTVESILEPGSARRAPGPRRPGGPALRVVRGGADDKDKGKDKDKRYLN
ncbi:MAG: hypothetical protein JWP97_5701 [Labilithrix sp.]|nr:hypothetical protein [Labilithrix sp.]